MGVGEGVMRRYAQSTWLFSSSQRTFPFVRRFNVRAVFRRNSSCCSPLLHDLITFSITMQALAKLIPIRAWQTIQQWEREDGTAPKRERLKAVAEALQTSEGWLLFGDQDTKSIRSNKTNPSENPRLIKEALQKWPFSVSPDDINRLPPEAKQRLMNLYEVLLKALFQLGAMLDFLKHQSTLQIILTLRYR